MAENAKSSGRVSKGASDLGRQTLFDEIGTEGFVLTVARGSGDPEEAGRVS
jgi:hypothetical protein